MPENTQAKEYVWGTGRRKSAVARVRIRKGTGKIIVNNKPLEVFFPRLDHQKLVKQPLIDTKLEKTYDVIIKVNGGGITGQAGAARLGIARAILAAEKDNQEIAKILKENEHLTRDGRMKERKKYGRHGARRGFQFSKR